MENKIFDILSKVHAEDELKRKTVEYLNAEIEKGKSRRWIYAVSCVALILFLACGGFFHKIYFTPVAYIDIDVNPSIELTLNSFGRVIQTNAYNEDGVKILGEVNLRYVDYNTAFEKLLAVLNGDGYFEQDSLLCVTVQTNEDNGKSSIQERLREIADITSQNHHYNIVTEIFTVTEEIKHCASENQISPAKYLAIQDLLRVDVNADFEECRGHSVHELRQQAEEYCNHEEESQCQGSGTHSHGHGEEEHHH